MPREPVPTILFVGTYGNRKRGALLVDAFRSTVRPAVPDAQLWMVCEDCPEMDGVVPLGRLSNAELVDRYHRAWIFCLPSSYEGFGIPYLEALAAELPVVATSNPGSRYVLDKGRAGVLCEPEALGRQIVELLEDETARHHLSSVGLKQAAHFELAKVADDYERIYRDLLTTYG